jgi:hypothetical protein
MPAAGLPDDRDDDRDDDKAADWLPGSAGTVLP